MTVACLHAVLRPRETQAQRRKARTQGVDRAPVKLDAVFNTTCTRVGGSVLVASIINNGIYIRYTPWIVAVAERYVVHRECLTRVYGSLYWIVHARKEVSANLRCLTRWNALLIQGHHVPYIGPPTVYLLPFPSVEKSDPVGHCW